MENMNNNYDDQGFGPEMPDASGQVDVGDMFDSPYYNTFLSAWDNRFMTLDAVQAAEEQKKAAVSKAPSCRRLFPVLMVFLFSLVGVAIAVAGALKISAVADYTVFSGDAAYENVLVLIDCLTKAAPTTIEGVFAYVLPVALFLSLALLFLLFILSFAALCSPKSKIGLIGLSMISFLLAVLAAVSLYIALGAPDLAGKFFDFGGEDAIGYGLVGILGCGLLVFVFSLFAYRRIAKAE